ncbi:MAG: L-threonine 3-dehydrogenase [Defluviitaleaceae bacterium]|nr:L-threonine 3-dehydrogenase [Defluviitaleaceae bacterium]
MKAIVKEAGEYGSLVIKDVKIPEVKSNEVLIKIKKTSICGTDVSIYKWTEWAKNTIKTPMIIGHEFVGTIEKLGNGVINFKVGDLVSGEGHVVCGKCRHCITGKQHLCRETLGIGVNQDGVFAQYISIPAKNVWLCGEGISESILSCLDPLGNAVHTALAFDVMGEDVIITGAGPIGLMSIPILKRVGARSIVITDINEYRLNMAKELGATATIDVSKEKISDIFNKLNIKEGFDIGLEMSGSEIAFADMIENMANGGKIAILGILPQNVSINWDKVIFNSLTLKGIYGREMFDTWYKMTVMLQNGMDKEIEKIITHTYHYTDFEKGFKQMMSGESGKIILEWE